MAVQSLETLAADLLEDKHLVCLYIVCENSGLNHSTLDVRSTDFDLSFCIDEKNLVKFYFRILGLRKAGDENLVSGLNLELATCNVNNCVHKTKNFLKFWLQAAVLETALKNIARQSSKNLGLQK